MLKYIPYRISLNKVIIILNQAIDQSIEKIREIGLDNAKNSKLYFIGFSAGGVMSHRMACTYSNRISGIASVSGVLTYHGK